MSEKRLFHSVAEQISDLIDEGAFPLGTRLPGERELAERFGVSRVTIREAEIALQAVGKIQIKTGSGVYVSEELPKDPGQLPDVSAFELTEARSLIESEAAALAAKVITAEALEDLQGLVSQMSAANDDAATSADRAFHMTIAKASGNKAIVHTIETLWRMREELPKVKKTYGSVCEEDAESRMKEHQLILDALKAHDPDEARNAMRAHFFRLISAMLDATEQEALREVQQRAIESRERFLSNANIGG